MKYLNRFKNENFIAFAACFFFWLVLYLKSGIITSGYQLIDDHRILNQSIFLTEHNVFELINNMLTTDFEIRFRPFYWISRAFLSLFLGDNWALWHVYAGLTAVFSSFFLYIAGRNIGFNPYLATLFSFLSLAGIHSEIWLHLCPAETLGMLLLAGAMYVLSFKNQTGRTKILFSILLILASLSKESFLIAMPAMVFLFNWQEAKNKGKPFWQTVKANMPTNVSLAAVCLAEILVIKMFIGTEEIGYAGIGASTFNFSGLYKTFESLIQKSAFLVPLGWLVSYFAIIIAHNLFISKDKDFNTRFFQEFVPIAIFVGLLVFPEIVLYSRSGWLFPRYLNPAMLGLAVLTAGSLGLIIPYINKNSGRVFIKALLLFPLGTTIFTLLFTQATLLILSASQYSNLCSKTTSAITFIKEQAGNKLLMVSDPAVNTESSASLLFFVGYYANKQMDYIYPVNKIKYPPNSYGAIMNNSYRTSFSEQVKNFESNPDIDSLDIVVFFSGLEGEIDKTMPKHSRQKHSQFIKNDFYNLIIYTKND